MKSAVKGPNPSFNWDLYRALRGDEPAVGRHQWDEVYLAAIATLLFMSGILGGYLL